MTTAKSEALIREKIGQQLARRSALQYDLEANQQAAANLQLLIDACDGNIRGLEQARSMMAEVEADLAAQMQRDSMRSEVETMKEYLASQQQAAPPPPAAPAPKPQKAKPVKTQAPRPAKRRGRPPKAKPEPIQDEPTQAGGSWNGNGGLTPEQAAAQ